MVIGQRGDLRPGAVHHAREGLRRGGRDRAQARAGQRDQHLHLERQVRRASTATASSPACSASTSASRRRWRSSRSAAPRGSFFGDLKAHGRDGDRVLHRQEGRHHPLAMSAPLALLLAQAVPGMAAVAVTAAASARGPSRLRSRCPSCDWPRRRRRSCSCARTVAACARSGNRCGTVDGTPASLQVRDELGVGLAERTLRDRVHVAGAPRTASPPPVVQERDLEPETQHQQKTKWTLMGASPGSPLGRWSTDTSDPTDGTGADHRLAHVPAGGRALYWRGGRIHHRLADRDTNPLSATTTRRVLDATQAHRRLIQCGNPINDESQPVAKIKKAMVRPVTLPLIPGGEGRRACRSCACRSLRRPLLPPCSSQDRRRAGTARPSPVPGPTTGRGGEVLAMQVSTFAPVVTGAGLRSVACRASTTTRPPSTTPMAATAEQYRRTMIPQTACCSGTSTG